jgi:beta-phosphoglucomutase family hydrolase
MIKAALFDMDGVVVDNHHYHFSAWMEFSRRHNFILNEDIYRNTFNGKTNADLFFMIFGNISLQDMEAFALEKESLYQELYQQHMHAHTGLVDFLEYLKAKEIKIALGTSAPTRNVDFTLDRLNLRKYFDVIVDGPQVKRGKPDPEVYLLCAQKLGVAPKDCVVFEDSLAGLESGKKAGCKIIGVATSHVVHELTPKTDLIIHDFTEARSILQV